MAKPNVRPNTFDGYEAVVRLQIVPTPGKIKFEKLAPQHVTKLINEKSQTDLSPTMVAYILSVLRNALNQALRRELVSRNVATIVKPPKPRAFKAKPLTKAEAETFLAQTIGNRDEALYSIALSLGLRQGKAFSMRWSDMDFDQGLLQVRLQL